MKTLLSLALTLLTCNFANAQFAYQVYPDVTGFYEYNIFDAANGYDLKARLHTDEDFYALNVGNDGQLNTITAFTTALEAQYINSEELIAVDLNTTNTVLDFNLIDASENVSQTWTFSAPVGNIIQKGRIEEFPDGDIFLSYTTGTSDFNGSGWDNVKVHYGKFNKITGEAVYEEVIDWNNHPLGGDWFASIYEVGIAEDNSLFFAIGQFTVIRSFIFPVDTNGNLGDGNQVSTLERYVQDLTPTADGGAWYWISQLGIISKINSDGTSTSPFFLFIDQVPMGGVDLGTFVAGPDGTTYIIGSVTPLGFSQEQLMVLVIGDDGSDQGFSFYQPSSTAFLAQKGLYDEATSTLAIVGSDDSPLLIDREMAFLGIDLSEPDCVDAIPNHTLIGEFEGSKYFLSGEIVLWNDAATLAVDNGGYLATITSQAENDFIQNNLNEIASIGFSDVTNEGTIAWQNGETVSFSNLDIDCGWCPGNTPDNDFGIFYPWNGMWDFDNQYVLRKYLIEVPCNVSTDLTIDLTCPDNINVQVAPDATEATVSWSIDDFAVSTNCGGTPTYNFELIEGPQVGANFPLGTSTVTYEVTATCDGETATATCSFEVTVDPYPNTITVNCPNDIQIQATNTFNYGGAIPIWDTPIATTDCGDSFLSIQQISGPTSGEFLSVFSFETVTYEVTDQCGGIETCSFTITVSPDYEVACPQNIIVDATSAQGAIVDFDMPTYIGSCEIAPFIPQFGLGSGDQFPVGTTIVPLNAQLQGPFGFCDGFVQCNVTVTVTPFNTGECPDQLDNFSYLGQLNGSAYFLSNEQSNWADAAATAGTVGGNLAVVTSQEENEFLKNNINEIAFLGFADDAIEGTISWIDGTPLDYTNFNPGCGFCPGNTDYGDFGIMYPWDGSWDFDGQFAQRKYIVEVACGEYPVEGITVDCHSDISIIGQHVNNYQEYVFWDLPTATTTCPEGGLTITQIAGVGPGETTYSYTANGHPIVYEFTDACGNSELCVAFIYVNPEATIYECPADIIVQATSLNGAVVEYEAPTLTSICNTNPDNYEVLNGLPSGSEFPIGTTTVLLRAFLSGNSATCQTFDLCSFNVTVQPEDGGTICDAIIPNYEYLGTFENSSYYLSSGLVSWPQAQQNTVANGGYLASISLQEENDFIQSVISEVAWIGMNDIAEEQTPVWSNGEAFAFDNQDEGCSWCPGNTADNDYGVIYHWNGKWDYTSVFVLKKALLEIPCQMTNAQPSAPALTAGPQIKFHKAYPNPTNSFIKFQFIGNQDLYTDFEIYDLNGKLIKTIPFQMYNGKNELKLDVRLWQDGLYFTRVTGVRQSEFKFIVANGI